MAEGPAPILVTEWNEIEPTIFERRDFSPEEAARWSQRPKELIDSVLRSMITNANEEDFRS